MWVQENHRDADIEVDESTRALLAQELPTAHRKLPIAHRKLPTAHRKVPIARHMLNMRWRQSTCMSSRGGRYILAFEAFIRTNHHKNNALNKDETGTHNPTCGLSLSGPDSLQCTRCCSENRDRRKKVASPSSFPVRQSSSPVYPAFPRAALK
jgi:hypothetical protein